MSDGRADQVRGQIGLLAGDVGRLRAHLPQSSESYTAFLAERVAARVDLIDGACWPTAADLYRYFRAAGLEEDDAAAAALGVVDCHASEIRSTLRWAA